MKYIMLNNGVNMPQFGLGVYKVGNEEVANVVSQALDVGYRSIDTAQFYENERGLGKAIQACDIPRDELFITSKVWNSHHGYEKTLQAFDESMEKLQLDYLDLYLVHWPLPMFDQYVETYKALEKLYNKGRVKAIGVSNFTIEHLKRIIDECNVITTVNQMECHPYFQQQELKAFCKENNIFIESWSPLAKGAVLEDEIILSIAEKHGKTPAQIILRW